MLTQKLLLDIQSPRWNPLQNRLIWKAHKMGNSDAPGTTKLNPIVSRYVRESGVSNTEKIRDNRIRHETPQQEPRTKPYKRVLNPSKSQYHECRKCEGHLFSFTLEPVTIQ